jgi:membrane fusion protein (multidrug efflux system)
MSVLRQLLAILVIGGLAYGVYTVYQTRAAETAAPARAERPRAAPAVEVVAAEERTLSETVEAVGTTRALQSVDIVPLAEGTLVALDVEPGRPVEAGAVIARLDSEIEEATLAEAEATLTERTRAVERSESLLRSNTISPAQMEQVRAEAAVARAIVDRARRRLADRTIRAPFSGVLGIAAVDLGARVDTGEVITSLDDLSEVEIEFRLPETVYGQIRMGQAIAADSAAFPGRSFGGTVAAVDSRIDPLSRSFRVRARLPNDDRVLPAGMFMRLDLAFSDRTAVVVPEEAVGIEGGEPFVFVVAGGKAERRPVEIGLRRGGIVEVRKGVAAGEPVIARGIQSVRDGGPVNVVKETPAAAAENVAAVLDPSRT